MRMPGSPNATVGQFNAAYDPTFRERTQLAGELATVGANVAIVWASSAGVFVAGSQFTFNMSTGRWMAGDRVATAAEALAAQTAALVGTRGSRGIWDLGWSARGFAIEQRLGGNLPAGF